MALSLTTLKQELNQYKEKNEELEKTVKFLLDHHMEKNVKKEPSGLVELPLVVWTIDDNVCTRATGELQKEIIGYQGPVLLYRRMYNTILTASRIVYSTMEWGWNEKVYQEALKVELDSLQYKVSSEIPHTLYYKGYALGDGVNARTDILVEDRNTGMTMLVELKAVTPWTKSSLAKTKQQCKRYLRLKGMHYGMIINFPDKPYIAIPEVDIVFDGTLKFTRTKQNYPNSTKEPGFEIVPGPIKKRLSRA